MKRLLLLVLISSICVIPQVAQKQEASANDTCASLNQPFIADDGLTVTVTSTSIIEKTGSYQLSVTYRLQNLSGDKKINEGYFEVQYSDGTKEWKGSKYSAMFPNDLFERTYIWEYLKTISPVVVAYRGRDDIGQRTNLGLHWPVLNESCSSLEAIRIAKEKATAELKAKQEAEAKAAADRAAADKAAAALKAKQEADAKAAPEKAACISNKKSLLGLQNELLAAIRTYPNSLSTLNDTLGRLRNTLIADCVSNVSLSDFKNEVRAVIAQAKIDATKTTTITCIKGKLSKKVTGINPKCPTGYVKK